jgi:outer membrane protein TolC
MSRTIFYARLTQALFTFGLLLFLAGCASVDFEQSLSETNKLAAEFTQGQLSLAQTREQRDAFANTAADILTKPVAQADAVRLALANSPAFQGVLAQNWANAANAAQGGRIANPVLTLERMNMGDEVELSQILSFGLLDVLTLPQRYRVAQRQIAQAQIQLSNNVIEQVTQVRQAWVKAVATQQNLSYARQVKDAAEASAELARRMQAAGNFTKLQRIRQQAFYADATLQLATAQHAVTSTREELVRLLGLSNAQAAALQLPERLPDLPGQPRSEEEVSRTAKADRLDIRFAQSVYEGMLKAQGISEINSYTDIELGLRRSSKTDEATGSSTTGTGYEVSVRLPLFDWGGNRRDALNAQTLAAAYRLEATVRGAGSSLRESYSAYRTAYDISKHYRDEIVPLRKLISEENVLLYNGMFIGVFELLADTREQISSVMGAIAATKQFWLADAALQASLIGKPTLSGIDSMAATSTGGGSGGH